jgi:hypothetical protein
VVPSKRLTSRLVMTYRRRTHQNTARMGTKQGMTKGTAIPTSTRAPKPA